MRFGRRQVVDADVRIYVQEVRAVHTVLSDGGMRAAVRLPGMRRACPPCPPDRTKLPHHVGRSASGRRKVRAHHRRIARPGKIARSRMQLLRRPDFQDGQTCQGESVSASLRSRVARPGEFPLSRPDFLAQSPWHPLWAFLDTYRTLCLAPSPEIREIFEELRDEEHFASVLTAPQ